ncbi:MAG: 50S ribosomal protein L11 methyltransferase [Clostridia bacterium]|nr:50S ribosomal protein L11 methyltransferase [Clostridia bacterium]
MKFYEIAVHCTTTDSEIVADIVTEITSQNVAIYDQNDWNNLKFEYIDTHSVIMPVDCVVCGFTSPTNLDNCMSQISNKLTPLLGTVRISTRLLDDLDWKDSWKAYFVPLLIGNIVILPLWEKSKQEQYLQAGYKCVLIDTSMAFGTGQHSTTAGCIEMIQRLDMLDKSVIDVGCGSGILSIVATALGATSVQALDYDREAVLTTVNNVNLNRCEDSITVKQSNLLDNVTGKCDILLANITADILTTLFCYIDKVLSPDSKVVLSGIVDNQVQHIIDLYSSKLTYVDEIVKGEWHTLLFCGK